MLQWHGWIKDYDSVTLMECRIDPILPHTRLPAMFARQRAALEAAMQRHSQCHCVRPGIPSDAQPLDIADIPGAPPARLPWACCCAPVERRGGALCRPAQGCAARAAGLSIPSRLRACARAGVLEAGWAPDQAESPPFRLLVDKGVQPVSPAALDQFMQVLACQTSTPPSGLLVDKGVQPASPAALDPSMQAPGLGTSELQPHRSSQGEQQLTRLMFTHAALPCLSRLDACSGAVLALHGPCRPSCRPAAWPGP